MFFRVQAHTQGLKNPSKKRAKKRLKKHAKKVTKFLNEKNDKKMRLKTTQKNDVFLKKFFAKKVRMNRIKNEI